MLQAFVVYVIIVVIFIFCGVGLQLVCETLLLRVMYQKCFILNGVGASALLGAIALPRVTSHHHTVSAIIGSTIVGAAAGALFFCIVLSIIGYLLRAGQAMWKLIRKVKCFSR